MIRWQGGLILLIVVTVVTLSNWFVVAYWSFHVGFGSSLSPIVETIRQTLEFPLGYAHAPRRPGGIAMVGAV